MTQSSWASPHAPEHRLAATCALLVLFGLQLAVGDELSIHPWWIIPILEVGLLLALVVANPQRFAKESKPLRVVGLGLIAVASVGTAYSAARLVWMITTGHAPNEPSELLLNGGAVWLMNVIVFALWFWELDRGGPVARAHARRPHADFLFPQMSTPHLGQKGWHPQFLDYFYVSFTNAAAFSPTDTMPLTRWAKFTMMWESAIALITTALVVARAINILH